VGVVDERAEGCAQFDPLEASSDGSGASETIGDGGRIDSELACCCRCREGVGDVDAADEWKPDNLALPGERAVVAGDVEALTASAIAYPTVGIWAASESNRPWGSSRFTTARRACSGVNRRALAWK
jgi:hypothetical protein